MDVSVCSDGSYLTHRCVLRAVQWSAGGGEQAFPNP